MNLKSLSLFILILGLFANIKAETPRITNAHISLQGNVISENMLNLSVSVAGVYCKLLNDPYPVTLEIDGKTLNTYYSEVTRDYDRLICKALINTKKGSQFLIIDVFSIKCDSKIILKRTINVNKIGEGDNYFNSYFGLQFKEKSNINDFDFFVPGIWYKDNRYLTSRALASDYTDNYFYFREDRLPLPVVSVRDRTTNRSISLTHVNANPISFWGENGLNRIVDERMQFGSLGFNQHENSTILFVYPGIEGEKTYTGRIPDKTKCFSYRSHPIKAGINHEYELQLGFFETSNIASLVQSTWQDAWTIYNPKIFDVDVNMAYNESIKVLDAYLENINGAPGWPFSIYLPNGTPRAYNYQMGFIGHQTSNAYFLLRNGLETKNDNYIKRASEVLDFWVNNSMTSSGLPRTWTDAYIDRPNTWRDYETYMRTTEGGMVGMIGAWNTMKKHGINKPEWLNYCIKYGDWLVKNQNPDGSFYIRYKWETGKNNHDSKYTTTNVIRFLIELYEITKDKRYLKTALKAGSFSYNFIHNDYLYVGGVIDNPNVKDRESGQMAIYAFLSLYDATQDPKWKDAAVQAARYTETFMFSYEVPMSIGDTVTDFPKHKNIIGQTLIATGHSGIDNGLSFSSFHFYRLYLLTGDSHFLHVAQIIQKNTLQLMDLDGKMGYRYKGLVTECFSPQANRGHSVRQQLPWNQAAVLDPMQRFKDAFNEIDIDVIESWTMEKRQKMIAKYAKNQGLSSNK